jgi:hypothetical protein
MAEGVVNKHPRLQDRLRPDTIVKISYDDQGEEPRYITGYWSIRGLGAPIRMMLSAAQVNHWIVLYDVTEEGDTGWSKESWANDKEWIKQGYNCLANLPFLIDCRTNMVLSQTNAIMSFLGRELNMLGRSPPMTCRCEELLCEIMDLRNIMVRFAYNGSPHTAEDEADAMAQGPAGRILDKLELLLENSYPGAITEDSSSEQQVDEDSAERRLRSITFLVGGRCTAPDFCLYEMLDQYTSLCRYYNIPLITEDRPYLSAYFTNFKLLAVNLPFLECGAGHAVLPFNNPYARFGSDWETNGPYERGQEACWRKMGILKERRTRTRPTKRPRTSR